MAACIFCRIVAGEVPSTEVYRDERVVAFNDIQPAAPVHVLVVPRAHVTFLSRLHPEDEPLLGHLLGVGAELARTRGIDAGGYRLLINQGANAGQQVDHLHVHLLGGRQLGAIA